MLRLALSTLAATIAVALLAPGANATPRILHARFASPPVAGTPSVLLIRVRDPLASVNGVQVVYGDGSVERISACRPGNGAPFLPLDGFTPGRAADFATTHVFRAGGKFDVAVVAMAGDCVNGVATDAITLNATVRAGLGKLKSSVPATASQTLCPNSFVLFGTVG